jgi:2-oxoisovalerate dehydrogenase E1 component
VAQISAERFPTVWVKAEASAVDLTIIGYGGLSDHMVDAAEGLFETADIVAQILCPAQIYPFDIAEYTDVVRLAPNVLFVEEGQGFGSFASEVAAQMAENAVLSHLKVGRIAAPPACIPASSPMEKMMLPGVEHIIQSATRLVRGSIA